MARPALGGLAFTGQAITDADLLTRNGIFITGGTTVNVPPELANYTGFILNMISDQGFIWQLAMTAGNTTLFSRVKWGSSGIFLAWKKVTLTSI